MTLFAVGTDSTEGAADIMVTELVERIGAQAVVAGIIGGAILPTDDQIDIEVGKFVFPTLKQPGVMIDGLGRKLLENDVLIATTADGGEIAGTSVFLEVPVNIEMGGGQHSEVPSSDAFPIHGKLFFDAADRGDLGFGELERSS